MQNLDADLGLYRDDGLLVIENSAKNVEKLKQEITVITIEANRKKVNYLDVTLNVEKQNFKPYLKPGDSPIYD